MYVVPAVQWALNTAYRVHHGDSPLDVMYGRAPQSTFPTLPSPSGGDWRFDVLDKQALRQRVEPIACHSGRAAQMCSRRYLKSPALGTVLKAPARRRSLMPVISCWQPAFAFLGRLSNRQQRGQALDLPSESILLVSAPTRVVS